MRKAPLTIAAATAVLVSSASYVWVAADSRALTNFRMVQPGMSVEEVETVLGPGQPIKQEDVPSYVVAVNPRDEAAALERAQRELTPPTARDYPVRSRPLVEGDRILCWTDARTRERILIAFRGNRVSEKHYHDPNYF